MVHVANNSGNNEWYTPDDILNRARMVLGGFDTDPASNEIAQAKVMASTFYTKENSGLLADWYGSVWMNPPYSAALIKQFCGKLKHEVRASNVNSFITLTNNATETKWFADLYEVSDAFCFLTKRVRFLTPEGNLSGQPLQGQVICYYGKDIDLFVKTFGDLGCCMVKLLAKQL